MYTSLLPDALRLVPDSGWFLIQPPSAQAAHYNDYDTVAVVKNQGDCYAMQGCDADDTYIYCTKVNTETETSAVIARVHKDTGSTTFLTNSASGTIKNNPNFSVWIQDTTFVDLFEIESVTICPTDGKMYFSTNRRKTSSDGNWDGVHYLKNFTYDPSLGDNTASANYRWNASDGELFSSNQNGCEFNHAQINRGTVSGNYSYITVLGNGYAGKNDEPNTLRWNTSGNALTPVEEFDFTAVPVAKLFGSVSGTTYTGYQGKLSKNITLLHTSPWSVEWKGTASGMLLATSSYARMEKSSYLYRSAILAFGRWNGTGHENYGIKLADYGIDGNAVHTYRLTNRINADGSVKMEGSGTAQYRGDITGISAKDMAKPVYAVAVYSDGTNTWYSGVLVYGITNYCSNQIKNASAIADLCKATVVYGYYAKQYFA